VTASDGQAQAEDAIEGGDGAEAGVAVLGPMSTFGAVERDGDQAQGAIRLRARSSSIPHGGPPLVATPFLSFRPQLSLLPWKKSTDLSFCLANFACRLYGNI
jgi:hypothetical protein